MKSIKKIVLEEIQKLAEDGDCIASIINAEFNKDNVVLETNQQVNQQVSNTINKKLYYHGRKMGGRPYSGSYIFITDNLGYASGYSDGKELYTYTIPFSNEKLFSIKNVEHRLLLSKYVDDESILHMRSDSGPDQELDWATMNYISSDDFDQPENLLEYLGFLGIRLKERTGIESIYIFNENKLNLEGVIDITTPEMIKQIGKFYKDFQKGKNFLEEIIKEEIETIKPNMSRSSGLGTKLVYLSIDKSYANAYANGQTSAAHVYKFPINNGVLFYVCLNENTKHYGGDIWISGYKQDIIDDLNEYKNNKGIRLENLTKAILYACGISEEPTVKQIDFLVSYFNKDDLSLMSPYEWSAIQENFGGYSEVCVKTVEPQEIIKLEIYQNGKIIKTINGGYKGNCETIFYHGSPLKFWEHLLQKENKNFTEGVADRYAEKQFNIQDPNAQQDIQAKGEIQKNKEKPYGYVDNIAIYRNPQSLNNFDDNVRAIADAEGNLYVAQKNGYFYHGKMAYKIGLEDDWGEIYKKMEDYLLLNRVANTNSFGLGDTNTEFAETHYDSVSEILNAVKQKNPQFKFCDDYYEKCANDNYHGVNENINEELNKISLQTAVDKKMFGPVYHGTTTENREKIEIEDFINEEISEFNKTKFYDVPQELFQNLKLRKFSDEANKSHMKIFKAKDGKEYLIKKIINDDIFHVYTLDNLQSPITTAVFDVHDSYFTGYEHNQSIQVKPEYRRLGLATALTDFAEKLYNLPYKPTNLQTPEMQGFVKNRFGNK